MKRCRLPLLVWFDLCTWILPQAEFCAVGVGFATSEPFGQQLVPLLLPWQKGGVRTVPAAPGSPSAPRQEKRGLLESTGLPPWEYLLMPSVSGKEGLLPITTLLVQFTMYFSVRFPRCKTKSMGAELRLPVL